ncbi:MAG TPA: Lrp/AsnC family transcriptional regulator [Lentisphaeria bacterium]|nr:Lrp/AsnC family transcriptional regulator [Lentisphaeria bacterium]
MDREKLKREIVALLRRNARMSDQEIADRLGSTASTVAGLIQELERDGVIMGYSAIVNEQSDNGEVRAIIEVEVRPERDTGFDIVAERLAKFPEVQSVYLVSGRYDLRLEVAGHSLQEIASFVSGKLAPQDGVKSTATYFLLKKYKEAGVQFSKDEKHERLKIVP